MNLTRKQGKVILDVYVAVMDAIYNEDGLDGADGEECLKALRKHFGIWWKMKKHGKTDECSLIGKHNVAECGLGVQRSDLYIQRSK